MFKIIKMTPWSIIQDLHFNYLNSIKYYFPLLLPAFISFSKIFNCKNIKCISWHYFLWHLIQTVTGFQNCFLGLPLFKITQTEVHWLIDCVALWPTISVKNFFWIFHFFKSVIKIKLQLILAEMLPDTYLYIHPSKCRAG